MELIPLPILKYSMALVTVMLSLTACSSKQLPVPPYAAEFAEALAETDSDYVRAILEDGEITAAEIKDAQGQVESCLAKAGIYGVYESNGFGVEGLTTTGELSNSQWQAMGDCQEHWIGGADYIYDNQVVNPNNEDFDSLVAQCFVHNDLVPLGFTGKDYAELTNINSADVTFSPEDYDKIRHDVEIDYQEVFLPGGVSLDSYEAGVCAANPSRQYNSLDAK